MKKAFIIGINGKMGRMLCESANAYGYEISGGYDIVPHPLYATFSDATQVDVPVDVIIDFSRADKKIFDAIEYLAKERRVPAVIATTGFCDEGLKRIENLAHTVPVFHSANMSLGIAATKAAAKAAQSVLGDGFDIEIVEKHHNQKADSPSGTALLLADALAPRDKQVINRNGKRNVGELGITSVRGGTVVGIHEIGFYGNDETVTVTHMAGSRRLFAAGAFKAADFLLGAKVGLYNMDDLVDTLI